MNLCVQCIHHEAAKVAGAYTSFSHVEHRCHAFDGELNPIVGDKILWSLCDSMRISNWCGHEGRMFAPIVALMTESPPPMPESDDAYRARLLLLIHPGSVNYIAVQEAKTGRELDEIGSYYEGGARK